MESNERNNTETSTWKWERGEKQNTERVRWNWWDREKVIERGKIERENESQVVNI